MYETGVLISLFIWAVSSCISFVEARSVLASNLMRIGLRIDRTGQTVNVTEDYFERSKFISICKSLGLFIIGFIGCLFSWLNVLLSVVMYCLKKHKQSDKPEAIKQFHWNLKNREMSFYEIASLQAKALGMNESQEIEDYTKALQKDLENRRIWTKVKAL